MSKRTRKEKASADAPRTQVITRKMEIRVNAESKEELNVHWTALRNYSYWTYRAFNQAISDYHVDGQIRSELYKKGMDKDALNEEAHRRFLSIYGTKDKVMASGEIKPMATTLGSRIYQRIRDNYPELPSSIASSIQNLAFAHYTADRENGLATGSRSLRSYKRGYPVPCAKRIITKLELGDEFSFVAWGIPFTTVNARKDNGNWCYLMDIMEGKAQLLDSQIVVKDKKLYLLASIKQIVSMATRDPSITVGVDLGINVPVACALNKGFGAKLLSSRDAFFCKRTGMQKRHKMSQKKMLIKGGHGRKNIEKYMNRYERREHDFSMSMNHKLSKAVIDFATRANASQINLEALSFGEDQARYAKLLRNWAYAQLQDMIIYKAKQAGIEVRFIRAAYTSQMCSACGHVDAKSRGGDGEKVKFRCTNCGKEIHADVNGAINIARSTDYCSRSKSATEEERD